MHAHARIREGVGEAFGLGVGSELANGAGGVVRLVVGSEVGA